MPDESTHHANLKCPCDGAPMVKIECGDVVLDRCGTCGAIWLDALELDKLLNTPQAARAADLPVSRDPNPAAPTASAPGAAQRLCPRDHSTLIGMVDLTQPHVRTNGCTVCGGVLLDAGELADLSRHTLGERLAHFFEAFRGKPGSRGRVDD